jgi:choline dehydrogenase-like flavoprotein
MLCVLNRTVATHQSPSLLSVLSIISGYFTDEGKADLATMREGLKLSRKLANSESFSKYKGEEIFPGKHVQSDAELDAYIRDVSPSSLSIDWSLYLLD